MTTSAAEKQAQVIQLADRRLDNASIARGLIEGDARAAEALYDRFGTKVNRLVWRLLGADSEHDDLVHTVFVHVLSSIEKLRNPDALEDWITGITVNTVRREIRSRKYRKIFVFSGEYQDSRPSSCDSEKQLIVMRLFEVLNKMKTEDHIVFVLRFIERNTLGEVAVAGGYSLATAKRRVAHAKKEFVKRAKKDTVLSAVFRDM